MSLLSSLLNPTLEQKVAHLLTFPSWKADHERYSRMNQDELFREYYELTKASFGRNIHCNNAKQARTLVASILLGRGITHIPCEPFSPIEIKA